MMNPAHRRKGFSILEALLAGLMLAFIVTMGAMLYKVVFTSLNRETREYGAAFYGDSPNGSAYARAILLHSRLKEVLSARTHFYVFGGYGQVASQATTATASGRGPLLESWHPATITGGSYATDFSALGPSVFAPYDTAGNTTIPVSAQQEIFSEPKNFTVVVMGGYDSVLAVAHTRCESSGGINYYRVTLYDSTNLARITDYRFSTPVGRDNYVMPVGATTYWEGVANNRVKRFTTPTYRIIFPDPNLTPDSNQEPVSTFCYYENAVR
jgi:hypothetical protein